MIDVGAGPPQFADAFCAAGARYVAVDADAASIRRPLPTGACAVVADGERLPLPSTSVDVCFSSNVLEHVRAPLALADELVRVTKPGGWIFLSYTNWLSPWGGHETSPFHYLGGRRAARIYTRRYGHQPKNRIGCNLFKISISTGLRWAVANGAVEVVDARPRYLPTWSRTLLRVPGLRELLTWNLLLVLRRQ
jgi:SAM-dependent methyltransferase